jgi:hypothetical protein
MVAALRLQATAELGRVAAFWWCKNGASTRIAPVSCEALNAKHTMWLARLKWLYHVSIRCKLRSNAVWNG